MMSHKVATIAKAITLSLANARLSPPKELTKGYEYE
jgi:hypothetical protein